MSWPSFLVGLGVTAALTPLFATIARRLGVVDRPGALKVHSTPVPLAGGLGVVAGWLAGGLAAGSGLRGSVVGAAAAAFALGMTDDVRPLPPILRVAGLIGVGTIAWSGGISLEILGPLGGVAVAMACVGATNGVNLLDGLDGLAGGCVAISALGLAFVGGFGGAAAPALAGAAVGFLLWNRHPARVFLGDGGAYAVGIVLAVAVALAAGGGLRSTITAVSCLGVFLVEPADAIVRRIRHRRPISLGDRDHTYDRMLRRTASVPVAVGFMWAAHAWLVSVGVTLDRAGAIPALLVLAAGGAALIAGSTRSRRREPDAAEAAGSQGRSVDLKPFSRSVHRP
jgi:UDP-GlcNAc:undecaprenyl-phosphate GlcNAc-1-phosphate transferase